MFLEDRILHNGRPDRAVLLVASFESTVLLLRERPPLFTARFLKEGGAIGKSRANFAGEMCARVGIMLFVSIRKVGTKSRRDMSYTTMKDVPREKR